MSNVESDRMDTSSYRAMLNEFLFPRIEEDDMDDI